MARVTVEDCIAKVPNRFELVVMAARRAKDIEHGAQVSVPRNNDKSTLIALREIAQDALDLEQLLAATKKGLLCDNTSYIDEEEEEDEIVADNQFDDDDFEDDFEDDAAGRVSDDEEEEDFDEDYDS